MEINIPQFSLVILIGVSGSGKSTFAKKHFMKSEIVSSDECRAIVSDDENNQDATKDAFELLYFIVSKRLERGLLTVVDATNVQVESRKGLIELARKYHCLPIAIVFDLKEDICIERIKFRTDRSLSNHIIRNQKQQLNRGIRGIKKEGFIQTYFFKNEQEVGSIQTISRHKLYNDKKDNSGPFDIIGDIHGCFDELLELLEKLEYQISKIEYDLIHFGYQVLSHHNRKVVFLGDLVDRGPKSYEVLKLVMSMINSGIAYCVPGNHDIKLMRYLLGKNVQINHGLDKTIEQLSNENDEFKTKVQNFISSLVSHYVFDNGKLVVAHAGLKENMQGRGSAAVKSFCLYGETTGEIDEFGLPVRYNWAKEYRGKAKVIYGHTPVPKAEWLNNTIDIDTGCVFGGSLTALQYPEEILFAVSSKQVYSEPIKPIELLHEKTNLSTQQVYDDLLDIDDVIGKRIIQTRLKKNITIKEENSISALEIMSRFAINPKWLIYLPPTMSPSKTSNLDNFLEHPIEALEYYKKNSIYKVVCQEKHMGSRAVVIVCRNSDVVLKRFGIENEGIGVCYTRTGRNFFNDENLAQQFIVKIKNALDDINFWSDFNTDWVCLDAEILPWSAKAQSLLKDQYSSVGSAALASLPLVENMLNLTKERGINEINEILDKFSQKQISINKYIKSYQNYCWEVNSVDDYKIAPFHILACENQVFADKTHHWHMEQIYKICDSDNLFFKKTPFQIVDLNNQDSIQNVIDWWLDLTSKGGEGMVVKPYYYISYNKSELLQAAIKCRGSEYLRIIYGPEYDTPQNMKRLKSRALSIKQSLSTKEFALGIESLERFVRKEALRRIHESVFAILALESEEVDPRL